MTNNKSIIAIIPARGGSKRLPQKNLMEVGGHPLLSYTLRHCAESSRISTTYVSTDDPEISNFAKEFDVEVIQRPDELSNDTASSESALLHVLDDRNIQGLKDPDLIVFLQCTSPVRGSDDIDQAIAVLEKENADTLFSGSINKRHIWGNVEGEYHPYNYDYKNRRREQDMLPQYNEDGSIYVIKPEILRQENNRLGGKIAVYPMGPWREYQLDTIEDVELLDWVLRKPEFSAPLKWPDPIELIVFDFDGVMTDNSVLTSQTGEEFVRANRSDGWGLARLKEQNVPMMVLSTEENPVTAARCKKLGIEVSHGIKNKSEALQKIIDKRNISAKNVIFLGNDENDLGCLKLVGLPVIVADAHASVKAVARLQLTKPGGHGAVRELCDLVIYQLKADRQ